MASRLPSTISEVDEDDVYTQTSAESSDAQNTSSSGKLENIQDALVRSEERAVKRTRILVGLVIACCTVGIILSVYFLSRDSDLRSFEIEYEGLVDDITALVKWEVRYNFALMEQLSSQITIASGLMNSTFPFHTEPQFEITGGFVDGMGGVMSAAFAPLVTSKQRQEWENYSVANQAWIENSEYLQRVHPIHRDALHGTIQDHEHDRRQLEANSRTSEAISPVIYSEDENGQKVPAAIKTGSKFAPLWQVSPANAGAVNFDLFSDERFVELYGKMQKNGGVTILSQSTVVGNLFDFLFDAEEKIFKTDPHGLILAPVYREITEVQTEPAGVVIGITPYGNLLDRLLPNGVEGIIGVFKDGCGDVISFELSSGKARFLGFEDVHEPEMNEYERVEENLEMYETLGGGLCYHNLYLYPSQKFRDTYTTNNTNTYIVICAIAMAICGIFLVYDMVVTRRQQKTMQSAIRSRAIVHSLFPDRIARDLVEQGGSHEENETSKRANNEAFMVGSKQPKSASKFSSKPLADLFPEATVMFGDLVGFTAWSSLREPHQVFVLLETIYTSFDEIAARRRVFKVETIGDCYVAVAGLPTPRKDHATIMARFSWECCKNLPLILHELEVQLGPDTSTLGIRIGLHSGPVTAGVLRGERARFQLFGDTVNTTSRIESTGERNKVHISEETAHQLINAGKEHWVVPREDKVTAKGKGELITFWLRMKNDTATASVVSSSDQSDMPSCDNNTVVSSASITSKKSRALKKKRCSLDGTQERFVAWAADILKRPLQRIVQQRSATGMVPDAPHRMKQAEINLRKTGIMTINEVHDVIELPKYDSKSHAYCEQSENSPRAELPTEVQSQLRDYIGTISCLYRNNAFHSFEHASHVLMSCSKLLSRITSPDLENLVENDENKDAKALHDHTYGITSDPLTQFAVELSALIHDLDHPGVPNIQLIAENDEMAAIYDNKSIAEQHSIDMAWELLMEDSYVDLRRAIYATKEELLRFRQLTVNAIMATDIMDKELGQQRKARWEKAFSDDSAEKKEKAHPESKEYDDEDRNRKATIVIEHIIQASDVAHTMQHWHIYKKWNERLFRENYVAYKDGRASKNPLDGWYEGEIGFFDFYIIPLAKKLKQCGVFGVSSDECLSYAVQNRKEWVKKGQKVVEEYAEIVRREYS